MTWFFTVNFGSNPWQKFFLEVDRFFGDSSKRNCVHTVMFIYKLLLHLTQLVAGILVSVLIFLGFLLQFVSGPVITAFSSAVSIQVTFFDLH